MCCSFIKVYSYNDCTTSQVFLFFSSMFGYLSFQRYLWCSSSLDSSSVYISWIRMGWIRLDQSTGHLPIVKQRVESYFSRFWGTLESAPIIGVIEGKHVEIEYPKNSSTLYHNCKGFLSLVILAIWVCKILLHAYRRRAVRR